MRNLERKREYMREWQRRNPEKRKQYSQRYQLGHLESIHKRGREWRLANPEHLQEYRLKNIERIRAMKRASAARCREHKRAYSKRRLVILRKENKSIVNEFKKRPCMDCGGIFHPEAMEFDHVRGVKKYDVGRMVSQGSCTDAVRAEILKCELVCANCHRVRTYNKRQQKINTINA